MTLFYAINPSGARQPACLPACPSSELILNDRNRGGKEKKRKKLKGNDEKRKKEKNWRVVGG